MEITLVCSVLSPKPLILRANPPNSSNLTQLTHLFVSSDRADVHGTWADVLKTLGRHSQNAIKHWLAHEHKNTAV